MKTTLKLAALAATLAPFAAQAQDINIAYLASSSQNGFNQAIYEGVDKTWGSCGAFSVCDGQPTIENCGPCDGYSVSPFGRPPHPSALSHAGIGNVID